MPKLTIVVPTIRPERWVHFYNNVLNNTKYSFEIIFVGPCSMIKELEQYTNIKVVRDFGSPVRARQMCLPLIEGELVTCTSDDCTYLPKVLDEVIENFPSDNYKHVFIGTYMEGQPGTQKTVQPEGNWKLNHAYPKGKYVDNDWWIFNTAFLTTKFLIELGGFDCRFQVLACADADLAVRAYRAGASVVMLKNMVQDIDWAPGIDGYGDHRPIWYAQTYSDMDLYKRLHNNESQKDRTVVSLDGWKDCPQVWPTRFDRATVEYTKKLNG
jgi:hypothetical protein